MFLEQNLLSPTMVQTHIYSNAFSWVVFYQWNQNKGEGLTKLVNVKEEIWRGNCFMIMSLKYCIILAMQIQ